jgi:hypothetical protein
MTNMQITGALHVVKMFCEGCRDEYEIRTPKHYNEVVNRILKFADEHKNCLDFEKALRETQEGKAAE